MGPDHLKLAELLARRRGHPQIRYVADLFRSIPGNGCFLKYEGRARLSRVLKDIGLIYGSLYSVALWVLAIAYLALFLLAMEMGFRFARRVAPDVLQRVNTPVLAIETAMLGLLGLLLGFSTSMSVSRFEERKHLVLEEANALGTSYLRTQLLASPHDKEMQALLCRYVDLRLESTKAGEDLARITAARNVTMRLQTEFWNKVSVFAKNDPHPVPARLLLPSINQAIDRSEE